MRHVSRAAIAQIQHNCLISGGRVHIKACKTLAMPRIGHFELAIITVFQNKTNKRADLRANIGWERVGICWERVGVC